MKKSDAIYMFGGVGKLANKLGRSRQAVYTWPEDLPQDVIDLITGAAVRLGIDPNTKEPEALK